MQRRRAAAERYGLRSTTESDVAASDVLLARESELEPADRFGAFRCSCPSRRTPALFAGGLRPNRMTRRGQRRGKPLRSTTSASVSTTAAYTNLPSDDHET